MVMWVLLGLPLACNGDSSDGGAGDISSGAHEDIPLMGAADLLVRASLDLRGIRPSDDEISQIEDDPASFSQLVDEFLFHENFPARVMDVFGEPMRTRFEAYPVTAEDFGLDDD